ncbi:hypothetical protein DPP11_14540 [Salmonella enterica subsp. enterica]|nr:hypothetical protein [Salmonella enterica subsp. enterica]
MVLSLTLLDIYGLLVVDLWSLVIFSGFGYEKNNPYFITDACFFFFRFLQKYSMKGVVSLLVK